MANAVGKRSQGARDYQEDYFSIVQQNEADDSSDVLIVLADGMGGHSGGDVASKTAVRAFEGSFLASTSSNPKNRLRSALNVANSAVADRVAEDTRLEGMGCTLIGALRLKKALIWVSVGDSHIFVLRQNELRKVNADHSVKGELMELVEQGKLTVEEVNANPKRNALRSAVVGKPFSLIDERSLTLEKGDIVLLCTDGVDSISEEELQDVVTRNKAQSSEAISAAVLKRVKEANKPNQDNTTVVVYKHRDGTTVFDSENSRWTLGDSPDHGSISKTAVWLMFGGALILAILAAIWFSGLGTTPEPDPEPAPNETVIIVPSNKEITDSRVDTPEEDVSESDATIEDTTPSTDDTVVDDGDTPASEEPDAQDDVLDTEPLQDDGVDPTADTTEQTDQ